MTKIKILPNGMAQGCECKTNFDLTKCQHFDNHIGCTKNHTTPEAKAIEESVEKAKHEAVNPNSPTWQIELEYFEKGANWQKLQRNDEIVKVIEARKNELHQDLCIDQKDRFTRIKELNNLIKSIIHYK